MAGTREGYEDGPAMQASFKCPGYISIHPQNKSLYVTQVGKQIRVITAEGLCQSSSLI